MNYLDYLQYCKVRSSEKAAYNDIWLNAILPLIKSSANPLVKQEYGRLCREWTRDADLVEDFWEKLRSNEIEREDARINNERMLHLKRNAAQQLNMAIEGYTKETKKSIDKERDSTPRSSAATATGYNILNLPAGTSERDALSDAGDGNLSTQTGAQQKQAGKRSWTEDIHDDTMSSRIERYLVMDKRKFWHLRSGRDVETVLFEASLGGNATFRTQLYKANPSPFDTETSEAFWCREAWPLLRRLLGNVNGITMIDGEKATFESKNRRNKGRRLDVEGSTPRKRKGKNVDIVGRDTRDKKDWFIVESMPGWDEHSTKFLRETSVVLFKELHLLASIRTQEVKQDDFVKNARFFAVYSGGPGFKTFQLRPTVKSPYIFLHQAHTTYILPSSPQTWTRQIQGIAHLLRIRAAMTETIQHYHHCLASMEKQDEDDFSDESDMDDPRWLYQDSESPKEDQTLGSSPLINIV
ncbi:hypothetical protein BGX21_010900 [Mortierella sp. AD011]|nr:hypothetical protein BGX20_011421 [Mortierella sp. AD010]KAF9393098.1 hypothetical protein BGX21_010900 [Mortierella sp. AD011]